MGKSRESRGRRAATKRTPRSHAVEPSPSLALLWGKRQRAARGPKPALSVEAVISAALALVDADGWSALTMTRVAGQLDVTPMAIYRYVPGKEQLVDLVHDVALGAPPAPAPGGDAWRDEVARWARASLALFQRRPWLLEAARHRVPIGPNWLAWFEAGLRAMEGSGLAPAEMINAVMLVDGHVRGTALLSAGATVTQGWAQDFRRVLDSAIGDERYPALTRLADAGGFNRPADQSAFEFGLERVLDGIATRVRAKRPRGRRS